MKYIPADKLIAEIERRLSEIPTPKAGDSDSIENFYRRNELMRIKKFVPTLQQEQPEVDLEKEINACWRNWLSPSNQKEVEGVLPKTEFAMYARHFYELGLNARKEESK